LGFIGITDVTFIHAEKIGFGAEAREIALTTAKSQLAIIISHDFMDVSNGS
jgi:FMN-dependent NADH-azoreductase